MTDYDIFNGDADGICALTQLRLAEPRDAVLVTGVKRDIELLARVNATRGDRLTVLDISMDKNKAALVAALDAGAEVFYADHHFAGEIPQAENLRAMINEAPDICTSILVNQHLQGAYRNWAIVGAFGDNLDKSANGLAKGSDLSEAQLDALRRLGVYINYNGYGSDLEELHCKPDELYRMVSAYSNPLDFINDGKAYFEKLETGYQQDMANANQLAPSFSTEHTEVFTLPNEAWAKRVSGVFGNDLANRNPDKAHAVLTEKANGNLLVSVRAPLNNKKGAAAVCRQFPTGGGREAAAGINDLPADMLDSFINTFAKAYSN